MTRGARSALGADALRGLLGAEELGPAAPAAAAAQPPKARKARAPRRRPASPRPAPPAQPASGSPRASGAVAAAGEVQGPPDHAPPGASPPRRRTNVQGYIDAEVLDRARDAAFWTPGASLSALIEQGLRAEILRLEAERGGRFPRRRGPLTPGPAVR